MEVLVILALITGSASACGGFACNLNQPVLQNAERIVFGVDPVHHEVEMHVQITYAGDADDFAWILPVPDVPDLFLTSGALFARLSLDTAPLFVQRTVDEGYCGEGGGLSIGCGSGLQAGNALPVYHDGSGGVFVADEKQVGPYDTVTLKADSVDALLGWLADNDYSLPAGSEQVLTPYVSADGWFVALKLRKDTDTGDLAPLALRYPGDEAIIPVQLTSVSATPDMRLEVYVFSDTRAVPESYLHVKINEAAINWATGGQNYANVITQAANEAGGHAFATDYYGGSDIVATLFDPDLWDPAFVESAPTPFDWMLDLFQVLPNVPPELAGVVDDHVAGIPDGTSFVTCPYCYPDATWIDDVHAATDDVVARVIEPLQVAQDLIDAHPKLTRMTSSMSAAEMTVDPVFVLNQDMAGDEVSNRHTSKMVYECGNGRDRSVVPRRFELEGGVVIDLPSQDWMSEHGTTDFRYIKEHDLADANAQVIEQTGARGKPKILVDHTADLRSLAHAANRALGCACDSSRWSGGPMAGIVLAFVIRRRK